MSNRTSTQVLGRLERFATGFRADYRFGPLNMMVMMAIALVGLGVHLAVYPFDLEVVIAMVTTALILAVCMRVSQVWEATLVLTIVAGLVMFVLYRPQSTILVVTVALAGLVAPAVQMAYQWEKAVVLRFGRFRGLRDSGVFALHLRAMNMVFEGLKQKGAMVIVPSSAVESMGLGALGGLAALARTQEGGDSE